VVYPQRCLGGQGRRLPGNLSAIQLSPIYTCGIGEVDTNRGIGLRFPRLIKVREDKKPHEASSNEFVIDLYRQQAVVKNTGNKMEEEDDFY